MIAGMLKGAMLLMALVFTTGAVSAQVIEKINRQQLMKIMSAEGYEAKEADSDRNVIWTLDGYNTLLLISENQESIQFYVAFSGSSATMERVNKWNQDKRYSRSYLDSDGDPVLELDLDLAGGVTKARIVDFLLTCRVSLMAWKPAVVD